MPLKSGQRAEAGTVGREGFVGIAALLDLPADDIALVQIPGAAYSVEARKAMPLLAAQGEAREVLTRYIGHAYRVAKQTSACNAFHSIEQRTARWLLTAQDRARRSEFPLTQEMLSHMVAATRAREPLADRKLDALVTFTRKIVEQRGFVADADVAAFLEAGYTQAQVIEVLLGVGMKTFNNYVDHIAHVPLNDQFKAEAWQPKRKAA